MACVYLHSAVVRAASLKYPPVLRKGVDSGFKVQWRSSSHQLKHLFWHTSPSLQGCCIIMYAHAQVCFGSARPAMLAASGFFFAAVITGYIWKSEKSHKAEPQSARRSDMLRQHYGRLAPFEEKTAVSCRECRETSGVAVALVMA